MQPLTEEEKRIIIDKETEQPFSGRYYHHHATGIYRCRQCGAPLYRSSDKFDSGCGWPSFDDAIPGSVCQHPDADGIRTEIVCAACGGHLGHLFRGEGFTPRNLRHCVNSASMVFESEEPNDKIPVSPAIERAIYAGGCFWGVEYMMKQLSGILRISPGYTGGSTEYPSYEEVCSGMTGHAEAVEIVFDPSKLSYETLTRRFFEIHDPTQFEGQGPDIGKQYRSEIFYTTERQKEIALHLIKELTENGYDIVTRVTKAGKFWPAETYHRNYYDRKGTRPYCHTRTKRFEK